MFTATNPEKLRGTLLCVPVLNAPAFETQTPYVCPLDGLNISGLFPGDMNGTASHRIAYTLFNDVALKANYIIDMHSGDLPEQLSPYSIFSRTGNVEADAKSEQMARLYGASVIDEVSPRNAGSRISAERNPGHCRGIGWTGKILRRRSRCSRQWSTEHHGVLRHAR